MTTSPPGTVSCPICFGHPDVQDTLEGIAEWWLLGQEVRNHVPVVKRAPAELVAQDLVLERSGRMAVCCTG